MYKLNGASGDKIGLGIAVHLMSGDNVVVYGKSFWHGSSPDNSYSNPVSSLLTALAGTSAVVAGASKDITAAALTESSTIPTDVSNFLSSAPSVSGRPKAYVNQILFDEQFNVVTAGSGFESSPRPSSDPVPTPGPLHHQIDKKVE